jgi:AcrR family transcriptional regulator
MTRHSSTTAAQIAESQRWSIITAAADAMADCGYARITSKDIARRAGVSPSTFYMHFEHLDACLIAASEVASESLWDLVAAACTAAADWPQRLRLAVVTAVDYLASEPRFARLLCAEASAGVEEIASAKDRLLERLAGLLCGARQMRIETANDLPVGLEGHLLAGAASLVGSRIAAGDLDGLSALAPRLAEILVNPYREPVAQECS